MRRWKKINRIPWRIYAMLAAAGIALAVWLGAAGLDVRDGRNDRGENGLILGPEWVADDAWFTRAGREPEKARFRDPLAISELAQRLRANRVADLLLLLPPPNAEGELDGVDSPKVEALLHSCFDRRPLIQVTAAKPPLADARWRRFFLGDIRRTLERHPRVRGVQLQIGPIADGDADFLALLDELRTALATDGRLVSVVTENWGDEYFRSVSERADEISVPLEIGNAVIARFSESAAARRTTSALACSNSKPLHFILPADGRLRSALRALHLGLSQTTPVPPNYRGASLDAAAGITEASWTDFTARFVKAD